MLDILSSLNIIETIKNEIATNDFASAGVITAALSAAFVYLRGIPQNILYFMDRRIFYTLHVDNMDGNEHMYDIIDKHVCRGDFVKKSPSKFMEWDWDAYKIEYKAGYSHYYRFINKVPCLVVKSMNEGDQNRDKQLNISIKYPVLLKKRMSEYFQSISEIEYNNADDGIQYHHIVGDDIWIHIANKSKRSVESYCSNIIDGVIDDIDEYKNNKKMYNDYGIPYRRGYIFEGPPGTGKSTLIQIIASKFNRDVVVLKPSNFISDSFSMNGERLIYVIEDIDCILSKNVNRVKSKTKSKTKPSTVELSSSDVSLSDILNKIDGQTTGEGHILIATTNHIDRLDPALIRPGRFDKIYNVGLLDKQKAIDFVYDRTGHVVDFDNDKVSGAEMQQRLVETFNERRDNSQNDT